MDSFFPRLCCWLMGHRAASLLKLSVFLVAGLFGMLVADPVRAQTILANPIATTAPVFTYGNLSFAITSCSFIYLGATQSCSADGTEIEGVFSGRGGTEIEILPTSGSYTQTGGLANTSLSFGLRVTDLKGSNGISSVSNILSGSVTSSADNTRLSSVLSGFNVVASPATITSQPGSLTSTTNFSLTKSTLSFNVALNLNTAGASALETLKLNSVKLLFTPAPEPASIGVLLVGVGGLASLRHRRKRAAAKRA
jgi:hypothetical protein